MSIRSIKNCGKLCSDTTGIDRHLCPTKSPLYQPWEYLPQHIIVDPARESGLVFVKKAFFFDHVVKNGIILRWSIAYDPYRMSCIVHFIGQSFVAFDPSETVVMRADI